MFCTWLRAFALAAVLTLLGTAAHAAPVLNSLAINDNRIMNMFGIYDVNGPAENEISAFVGNFYTGDAFAMLTFKTPTGEHIVGGLGVIRGRGTNGAQFRINARDVDGYRVKVVGDYSPEGIGRYHLSGTLKGPDINTTFTISVVPPSTTRGLAIIDRETVNGGSFQWNSIQPDYDEFISNVSFTRPKDSSVLRITEEHLLMRLPGTLFPVDTVFGWQTKPPVTRIKLGKTVFLVPTSRISLLVDNIPLGLEQL